MILNKSQPSCPIFAKPLLSLKNAETCQEYASPQNGVRYRAHLTEALKALALKVCGEDAADQSSGDPVRILVRRIDGFFEAECLWKIEVSRRSIPTLQDFTE